MNDRLQEIFDTLNKNKLRTTLTGLSVSWGIFILIVLLGAGNGLKNGVISNFSERAINRVNLSAGTTSMPYRGLKSGRNLKFSEKQVQLIRDDVQQSDLISPRTQNSQTISYGAEYGSYGVRGVLPDYLDIYKLELTQGNGRFINSLDVKEANKIIVLDKKIEEVLFKGKSGLGKYVKVGQVMFKVVGINTKKERWGGSNSYIPFTTAQLIFNPDKKFYNITLTANGLNTKSANENFTQSLRNLMARNLSFNPEDKQAMWIDNSQEDYIETMKIFNAITLFVTIIGILTLIAGIVGVSNIMLVSVKERTREIGIRKAIGAPSSSILKTIILESIIITAIFGYIGMMAGVGLTELINFVMQQSANAQASGDSQQMTIFQNPTVGLGYVLFATGILIVAGVISGYLPARKAVKVKPVEAMRQE